MQAAGGGSAHLGAAAARERSVAAHRLLKCYLQVTHLSLSSSLALAMAACSKTGRHSPRRPPLRPRCGAPALHWPPPPATKPIGGLPAPRQPQSPCRPCQLHGSKTGRSSAAAAARAVAPLPCIGLAVCIARPTVKIAASLPAPRQSRSLSQLPRTHVGGGAAPGGLPGERALAHRAARHRASRSQPPEGRPQPPTLPATLPRPLQALPRPARAPRLAPLAAAGPRSVDGSGEQAPHLRRPRPPPPPTEQVCLGRASVVQLQFRYRLLLHSNSEQK